MSDQLANDIRAVRDHIDRVGWWRGSFYKDSGAAPESGSTTHVNDPCCLEGGARLVLSTSRWYAFYEHLLDQIAARGDVKIKTARANVLWGGDGEIRSVPIRVAIRGVGDYACEVAAIPHFNDHVLKDKADVLEFLDKAAIAADEKA